jgi:hypothetical protein
MRGKLMKGEFVSVKANTEAVTHERLSDEEVVAELSCVYFKHFAS